MDTSSITKPEDLPFYVPELLAHDINELISAIQRNDINTDAYANNVESSARELSEDLDMKVRRYYSENGWHKGEFTL